MLEYNSHGKVFRSGSYKNTLEVIAKKSDLRMQGQRAGHFINNFKGNWFNKSVPDPNYHLLNYNCQKFSKELFAMIR